MFMYACTDSDERINTKRFEGFLLQKLTDLCLKEKKM